MNNRKRTNIKLNKQFKTSTTKLTVSKSFKHNVVNNFFLT